MPAGRPRTRQEGDLCEDCGVEPVRLKGRTPLGAPRYDKRCNSCHKGMYGKPWLKHRSDECEMCGYRPFFKRTLDVHHRDSDKSNNDPSNLMTVCSNCHRELEGFIHQTDGDYHTAESLMRRFINALLK
jgi:DNA-directed RNA polymerase subunit RPC12/RpoP